MTYTAKPIHNYFSDDSNKFLPETMGNDVSEDVMFGPDGSYWVYEDGAYHRDPLIIQKRVNAILKNKLAVSKTNAVCHYVDGVIGHLTHDKPESDLINVLNGMYNPHTQELEPHSPEFHSIVQLPINYDPEAKCPIFDAFLSKVCPSTSLEMLWEIIGYLLIPGNPFQKAILFYGGGSNGKSTFINVMEAMVGRSNCSNITLKQLSKTFEPAELLGKQLNTVGDLAVSFLEDTETFKKITGGDPITAQRKNKDPFTFTNWAVPLFATNSWWKSRDLSEGYFRRWQIVSFPNKVTENDFSYTREDLTQPSELSGIFNKAMQHLPALLKRKKFVNSWDVDLLFMEFQHESDNVAIWLDDDESLASHINPTDHSISTNTKQTYQKYRQWSMDTNNRALSNQQFYKRMRALGYVIDTNRRVIYGIAFKNIHQQTFPPKPTLKELQQK